MAIVFVSLNEAVHAVEKLPHPRLRCLHPFDQADFGLCKAAYHISDSLDLLFVPGDLPVVPGNKQLQSCQALVMLGDLSVMLLG